MSFNSRKTPYYLLDLENVKKNYFSFQECIKSARRNDIIAYSVKANYNPAIIAELNKFDAFFEVCSEYEYNLIQKCGISDSRIIVNGCFYNDFSKYNESILILDTYTQLLKWSKTGCKGKIGIRVNLDDITADDRFMNKKSRFGINIQTERVKRLFKKITTKNIICLHCHLSGNNREPSIYRDIIVQLQQICDEYQMTGIRYFDIGGGYKIDEKGTYWEFADYVNAVDAVCKKGIQIIFEPGNSLVRNSGEYHTEIIAVKDNGNDSIFVVDGSTSHIPKYDFKVTGFHFEHLGKGEKYPGRKIYGNTCKESDLLLSLNDNEMLTVGDRLVIENIGAYSLNEANPLIIGMPNVYFKTNEQMLIGNRVFNFVCRYSDCFNVNKKNSYSKIKNLISQKGLYAFVHNGIVIYIGVAHDRSIDKRVVQHFRQDTGGLRNKISKEHIKELEESSLYVCQLNDTKRNLLFEEAYIIGLYRPKFNFI